MHVRWQLLLLTLLLGGALSADLRIGSAEELIELSANVSRGPPSAGRPSS